MSIIHWTKKKCRDSKHFTCKPGRCFVSSPTASHTKCVTLTWLSLEIMHHHHTRHDYQWPWVSLTWLLYNLQVWHHKCWFRKFTVHFWPIRKEIASSMYNMYNNSDVVDDNEHEKNLSYMLTRHYSVHQGLNNRWKSMIRKSVDYGQSIGNSQSMTNR